MSVDITKIPLQVLLKDKADSLDDIMACTIAVQRNITSCSSGSVIDRLEKNLGFVKLIEAELSRRKEG